MNKLQHDNSTSNVGDVSKDHLNAWEERLKAVEGHSFDVQEAVDVCLVQDIQFPSKFKIPDFQKYTGAICPKGHLTKAVEGHNFDVQEAVDVCLVQDIQFPSKFKIPDFQKYTGAICPKGHLTMYCRKMAAYVSNEKLLIHYFQESLSDVALKWYMQLDGGKIQTWKQLADAFLRRYKYNIDLIPDRSDLQSFSKKGDESFKTYAQR
uniref:Retrotransposon gag domain-containing protein n=1 Tax=Cajanus cajan TaxID=3821 RepID=A0A151R7U2_CAJCA|nr:hypothetical protein KK1_040142 [Cajanus cajan]